MKNIFFLYLTLFSNIAACENKNNNEANSLDFVPNIIFVPISQGSNLYTQYHKPIYTDECECWNLDLKAPDIFNYKFNFSLGDLNFYNQNLENFEKKLNFIHKYQRSNDLQKMYHFIFHESNTTFDNKYSSIVNSSSKSKALEDENIALLQQCMDFENPKLQIQPHVSPSGVNFFDNNAKTPFVPMAASDDDFINPMYVQGKRYNLHGDYDDEKSTYEDKQPHDKDTLTTDYFWLFPYTYENFKKLKVQFLFQHCLKTNTSSKTLKDSIMISLAMEHLKKILMKMTAKNN